jgi:hypothetical protein
MTVKAGNRALQGWTVSWMPPPGQTVVAAFGADLRRQGSTVIATNAWWNGAVRAGKSVQFSVLVEQPGPTGPVVMPPPTCAAR